MGGVVLYVPSLMSNIGFKCNIKSVFQTESLEDQKLFLNICTIYLNRNSKNAMFNYYCKNILGKIAQRQSGCFVTLFWSPLPRPVFQSSFKSRIKKLIQSREYSFLYQETSISAAACHQRYCELIHTQTDVGLNVFCIELVPILLYNELVKQRY